MFVLNDNVQGKPSRKMGTQSHGSKALSHDRQAAAVCSFSDTGAEGFLLNIGEERSNKHEEIFLAALSPAPIKVAARKGGYGEEKG
jgi:hypothetical protein